VPSNLLCKCRCISTQKFFSTSTSDLDGQEVGIYRNHKGFWGLISQVACDSNAKVRGKSRTNRLAWSS